MLCKGELKRSAVEEAQLKCRYSHNDNPYLYLARLREEEANHSPRILLCHDVLSDAEISTLKRLAQSRVSHWNPSRSVGTFFHLSYVSLSIPNLLRYLMFSPYP